MSTRTITTDATGEHVVTSNGVTTTTDAVMRLAVPAYDPRTAVHHPVTGINADLMLAVRDQIEANRTWWNQSVWRDVVETMEWVNEEFRATPDAIKAAVAYGHESEPACGTSMCFAGWATEIARADWVLDAKALRHIREQDLELSDYEDLYDALLVPWGDGSGPGYRLTGHGWLNELLAERGFTGSTHYKTTVPQYATSLLFGDDPWDPLDLFGSNHSFEYVVAAATYYAGATKRVSDNDAWDALQSTAHELGLDTENVY